MDFDEPRMDDELPDEDEMNAMGALYDGSQHPGTRQYLHIDNIYILQVF